jgi:GxxExxY protein
MSVSLEMKKKANQISNLVLGAAIEVHRHLGPGLLESAYEGCLCHELTLREVPFERQVTLPVVYKGLAIDCAYRLDVVIAGLVVLELKAVEKLEPIHDAQFLTYLRLTGRWLGLLINFNVPVVKDGFKRLVNG